MSRPAILEQLRAETRPCHERLEQRLSLLDGSLDRSRYEHLLARFHAIWQGLEPRLATLLADPAFFEPRRRLALLTADLRALGLDPAAIRPAPPPALADRPAALGALYVLEGSTLGGRVILRHLESLALPGTAYFAGYGTDTGRMWLSFVASLEAAPAADRAAIVDAANATFAHLEGELCREGSTLPPARALETAPRPNPPPPGSC